MGSVSGGVPSSSEADKSPRGTLASGASGKIPLRGACRQGSEFENFTRGAWNPRNMSRNPGVYWRNPTSGAGNPRSAARNLGNERRNPRREPRNPTRGARNPRILRRIPRVSWRHPGNAARNPRNGALNPGNGRLAKRVFRSGSAEAAGGMTNDQTRMTNE
jgi:hypothetical protein